MEACELWIGGCDVVKEWILLHVSIHSALYSVSVVNRALYVLETVWFGGKAVVIVRNGHLVMFHAMGGEFFS